MKKLLFFTIIILLCTCVNNNHNNHEVSNTNVIDENRVKTEEAKKNAIEDSIRIHAEAIKNLQSSTITSVYMGLQLGMVKDSVVSFLTDLHKEGRITDLRITNLNDDSDYRCTGIVYHNDSYHFLSTINVKIDSVFYSFLTSCTVDFYKNKLYSVVVRPYSSTFAVKTEKGWSEIENIYEENYGIGFTTNSTYEFSKSYEPDIYSYMAEIEDCLSYTTNNKIWTTSNVQIILANKRAEYKVNEYEENSFKRLYDKYEREYRSNIHGLVYRLESEARLVKSSYKYRNNYLIIYKDIKLHNEVIREQQIALEEENRIKTEEARKKAIEDSIRQERIKEEYENQLI